MKVVFFGLQVQAKNSMTSPERILYLYSTPACHLCEIALTLIEPFLDDMEISVEEVDISDSDELMERYGLRIPVLKFSDSDEELGWPFSEDDFLDFVRVPK